MFGQVYINDSDQIYSITIPFPVFPINLKQSERVMFWFEFS